MGWSDLHEADLRKVNLALNMLLDCISLITEINEDEYHCLWRNEERKVVTWKIF